MALAPYPLLTSGPEQVELKFRFQINGTSNPDNVVGSAGLVEDITRNDTGEFTVTIHPSYRYQNLVVCHASVQADLDVDAKYVSWTPSTGALVIHTVAYDDAPAAGDPADDSWVHVTATLCRRSEMLPTTSV